MATLKAYVARSTLLAFCITGIVVTAIVTTARIFIRISKQGRLYSDDYALFIGVLIYWTMAGLYIADLPHLYAFLDYTSGKVEFQPEVITEYAAMMRYNFAVTTFFWAVLWSVKASLLLFFRRIIKWTDWMRVWWIIAIFTGVTFIGCIVSQYTSCDSIRDFTVLGACTSPRETRAQIISLYYSFAADVVTELAVMALPMRVIIGLKLSRKDKISLICLFSVGIIAIVVSMIRVFLIWAKTGSTTPSPAWLAFWAVVECMVAIVVGCIPAISQVLRGIGGSSHNTADSNPYEQRRTGTSAASPGSWPSRGRKPRLDSATPGATSSEENLFNGGPSKTEILANSIAFADSNKRNGAQRPTPRASVSDETIYVHHVPKQNLQRRGMKRHLQINRVVSLESPTEPDSAQTRR